ncbi:unnamed protein product [Mytilus edulis]|uniref:Reverse transcriptase domain-containing protein n=1 Tax=Mytilus edulis TaxID=6550 RepID=A0A8S3VL95_MYTED|nr:unnamed protein product [Mytilus edulis]
MLEKMDYKVIKVSLGLNNKNVGWKKPWWSDHLTILWNDVCAIEKEMLKSKSDTRKRQCRQEFICKRKLFDRETQRSKRRYWRDQLNEIDNLESTNQTEFWKKIGRVGVGEERRKAIPMSVQLPDGSISHDRDAVLNEWKRSFCSLLNPEGSIDNLPTDTSTDNGATMNYDITHEEVKRAVISLKVNKAVGVDEIPAEVLKNPRLLNFLLSLFNKCFFSGTIPTIWRKGIINPIPKSSTSNPKDPMCYRGLTLVPVCYKLYCHILNNRLLEWEEENNILDDCQNGFRKGRSTIDHIKSLSSIIETRKLKRLSTFTAFIDFRKAYDGIDRNLLCQKLLDIGICGNMYNAIVSLYKSVECCVRVNGQLTDWFNVQCGLKQGCLLSPLLFNVYVNGLVTYICSLNVGINIDEENVSILLYADDLVLLAGSESDLQVLLDGLQLWCAENKMTINHNKSNVVHFRPNSTPRTINSFKCGELDINVVGKYTYLGLVLTEHLDYQIMAKHVAASANRALGLVISKYKSFGGLPFDSFTKLYDSIVWSTISYGAAVWGDRTFSCINSIQNKAIRFYMGVGRYTPNVAVNGDSAWKPPCVRQWRTVINQWNRLRYMNTDRLNKRIHNWAEHSFRRYKACKNSNYRLYQQFESCNISDWYNDTNIHKTTVLAKIEDKLLTDFRNKWTEDLHRVSARRMDGALGEVIRNMASLQNMSTEELPNVCGAKLNRKDVHCQNKPKEDGKCWRHRMQFNHDNDGFISKLKVNKTIKELRQIAKEGNLKGCSRLSKINIVNLIEDKTNQRIKREEVFTTKQLKAPTKRREIHNYSRRTKKTLFTLIMNKIEHASIDEELEISDGRDALNGVFGTVKIGSMPIYQREAVDGQNEAVELELPEPGTFTEFDSYNRAMRVSFAIYADFECFVEKIDTCQPNSSKPYTKQYQHQEPSGYCYHVKYEHVINHRSCTKGLVSLRNSSEKWRKRCERFTIFTKIRKTW